jgi:phosphoglucosamine mutase
VGFAYDGDADRCLCVDEQGNVVDGDKILYVSAAYLKERNQLDNNTVVATVMSNIGLFKALDKLGIDYAKTAVGDKNVYDYMAAHNNIIGGEQSGHVIFAKHASTGDGILTSLKIMEVMLAKKRKLSELTAPVTLYPQLLVNVRVTDKKLVMAAPLVIEAVKKAEAQLEGNGRMLVRESGTEPLVRVMAEAADIPTCEQCVKIVTDAIAACGYVVSE